MASESAKQGRYDRSYPALFETHPMVYDLDRSIAFCRDVPGVPLAHVIPAGAAVVRPPIHGLDVPEVTRFVAAMEDPPLDLRRIQQRGFEPGHLGAAGHGRRPEIQCFAAHSQ